MGFLSGILGMLPGGIGKAVKTAADVAQSVLGRPNGQGVFESLWKQAPKIVGGLADLGSMLPGPYGAAAGMAGDIGKKLLGAAGNTGETAGREETEDVEKDVEDEERDDIDEETMERLKQSERLRRKEMRRREEIEPLMDQRPMYPGTRNIAGVGEFQRPQWNQMPAGSSNANNAIMDNYKKTDSNWAGERGITSPYYPVSPEIAAKHRPKTLSQMTQEKKFKRNMLI